MGLARLPIKVSTWIPTACSLCTAYVWTNDSSSSLSPSLRRLSKPPLVPWHAYPSSSLFYHCVTFHLPEPSSSLDSLGVVPTSCKTKTHRYNNPAAFNSFHTYSAGTTRLLHAKYLPCCLNTTLCSSHIVLSANPHLAVHALTFTPQNPPESCFNVSEVHTRVSGPLCSCWIRQADRQPTLDLTAHALNSRAGLQEAGQWSVERTEAAVGSMSPLASRNSNSNSRGGRQELSWCVVESAGTKTFSFEVNRKLVLHGLSSKYQKHRHNR